MVREVIDEGGDSTQFFNGQRIVLMQQLPTADLAAGHYELRIEVEDRITRERLEVREELTLLSQQSAAIPN